MQNVKLKNCFRTCSFAGSFAVFVFLFAIISFAQPKPKVVVETKIQTKIIVNESDIPAEKSIETDAKVNVSLCVDKGKITINGWNRNEVRAFVSSNSRGSQVGFKSAQDINGKPALVNVLGFNPQTTKDLRANECLSGDEIELDVPQNAVIKLKARESEVSIANVAKVHIENVSGEITLREISNSIDATTYEGDLSVSDSHGSIFLTTTSGNILVFDVSMNEIGDIFKAKTSSGLINLKNTNYTQVDVNSNSGSIRYNGDFSNGGQYNFGTSNGAITISMPTDSSCKLNATYSFGAFDSEIPFKADQKSSGGEVKKITAMFGKGDATVNLTTFNGKILIKKR